MTTIKELRRLKAAKLEQAKSIIHKSEGDNLSDDELSEVDKLKGEAAAIAAKIAKLEELSDMEAEDAKASDEDETEEKHTRAITKNLGRPALGIAKQALVKRVKGSEFARYAIGKFMDQAYGFGAGAEHVEKHFGDMQVKAALTTAQPVVPQDFVKDPIDLLTAKAVVRASGATVEAMPHGQKDIPRERLNMVGSWTGEGQDIGTTANDYDMVRLLWKKLGAISATTKELIEYSPVAVEQRMINNITLQMALAEDIAFLTGNGGSGFSPKGIVNLVAAGNKFPSNATVNFETVNRDLNNCVTRLKTNNVAGKFVWYMTPVVTQFLRGLMNAFGQTPFADQLDTGKLKGFEVYETTQLESNAGTGTNEAKVILACVDHLIIGDAMRMQLSFTDTGSYVEGGVSVNTFSKDLVAFKVTNSVDFAMMHDVSAVVMTTKNWNDGYVTGPQAAYIQAPDTSASNASSTKART